ncbi:MAG: 50S ribosomal protein L39e [Candidatus Omnitrophica bacterium]|nr:50S ribosomal protein L39e [Candidatus Omnitrophota bacterium]
MSKKSLTKKLILAKKIKQNRAIPLFIVAKTKRRVRQNNKKRNWRNKKLKIKIK